MIVFNQIALLTLFTFQRFILNVLTSDDNNRFFALDGNAMTVSVPTMPGVAVIFTGSGLGEDVDGNVTGNITNFQIVDLFAGKSLDGLLPVVILAQALLDAANAGEGEFNSLNYALFYNLLMPSIFFQLFYTGGPKGEVAEGFAGDDEFNLGRGNDLYILGTGADKVNGGNGVHDAVTAIEQSGGVLIDLDRGIARTADGSRVRLRNIEDAEGSDFRDKLNGNQGNNELDGGRGNDDIFGDDGNDQLDGGRGNDDIDGGLGDDNMTGGPGLDDFFVYPNEGDDVITDFEDNVDALDLTEFDFEDEEDALSFAEDTPDGVLFIFAEGGSLLVEATTKAELADDIIF